MRQINFKMETNCFPLQKSTNVAAPPPPPPPIHTTPPLSLNLRMAVRTRHLLRRLRPPRRGGRRVRLRRPDEGRFRNGDGGAERGAVRAWPDLRRVLGGPVRGGHAVVHSRNLHHINGDELLRSELRLHRGRWGPL